MTLVDEPSTGLEFFSGGGEMGALMRAHDWSATPLGPAEAWPQSLRTTVSTCLNCAFPILVWWGRELVMLYNDEYRTILGASKHPRALGAPGREVWDEIWDAIGPMVSQVVAEGRATRSRDLRLVVNREGYDEERFFSFSYSPIRDETGGVGGVFCPVIETTRRVLAERRMGVLTELSAAAASADARSVAEAEALCLQVLQADCPDVPFALLYRIEDGMARLSGAAGMSAGAFAPHALPLSGGIWPLRDVLRGETPIVGLPPGTGVPPAGEDGGPVRQALLLPVPRRDTASPAAVLVLGLNPLRALDEDYRSFLDRVAAATATAIANARAFEVERDKAEALARLDRARTRFLADVSDEFRTPLTLMLGPLKELLASEDRAVQGRASSAHRNALRLLKLVNALLEFSRIEAGRVEACFRPTDLSSLTADLASAFSSVFQQAGLRLEVDCKPLPGPVFVDRGMWEKITGNLLSNAFKFTLEGGARLRLSAEDGTAVLQVEDSGVGIPEAELPRIFERFHRIEGQRGRSIEGSGIGLALVRELVALHGGTVTAESPAGGGSTFTVRLPMGAAHLPPDQVAKARDGFGRASADPGGHLAETLGWLPDQPRAQENGSGEGSAGRVLLADDNAEMRAYVGRLLRQAGVSVEGVVDGEAALEAARSGNHDLVVADLMMPRLDGIALARALRAEARTRDLPVILLSSRTGEEARIEGLAAGADDYLVKPFSGAELVARVLARLRSAAFHRASEDALRASEAVFRAVADHAPAIIWLGDAEGTTVWLSRGWYELTGQPADLVPAQTWLSAAHPEDSPRVRAMFLKAVAEHTVFRTEYRLRRPDGTDLWVLDTARPRFGRDGRYLGHIGAIMDIDDRRRAEQHRTLLIDELNHRVKNTLSIVQGIAHQSLRQDATLAPALVAFEGRLNALAAAHGLLTKLNWEAAALQDIVGAAIRPVCGDRDTRVAICSVPVRLRPKQAVSIAIALHELATNALKYGALSSDGGRIEIDWDIGGGDNDGKADRLRFSWTESGGPAVSPPARRGFGSRLIERALAAELGGAASLDFRPEGVVCRIEAPLGEGMEAL